MKYHEPGLSNSKIFIFKHQFTNRGLESIDGTSWIISRNQIWRINFILRHANRRGAF